MAHEGSLITVIMKGERALLSGRIVEIQALKKQTKKRGNSLELSSLSIFILEKKVLSSILLFNSRTDCKRHNLKMLMNKLN